MIRCDAVVYGAHYAVHYAACTLCSATMRQVCIMHRIMHRMSASRYRVLDSPPAAVLHASALEHMHILALPAASLSSMSTIDGLIVREVRPLSPEPSVGSTGTEDSDEGICCVFVRVVGTGRLISMCMWLSVCARCMCGREPPPAVRYSHGRRRLCASPHLSGG